MVEQTCNKNTIKKFLLAHGRVRERGARITTGSPLKTVKKTSFAKTSTKEISCRGPPRDDDSVV